MPDMATSTLLTIGDYERLPQETVDRTELIDGELVDVSGNTLEINLLRGYLIYLLRPLVHRHGLGAVISNQGFDIQGNVLGPDVSFFGVEKVLLVARGKRVQPFVPDLAIEIPSPTETYDSVLMKRRRYLDSGVQEVWLICAETREVTIYPRIRVLRGSDELSTPLIPGFSITVNALFAEAEV
jgi:Uma2 family endonuclease